MNDCFECGQPAEHQHHVVPISRGGTKTVPLCMPCHAKVHDLRENWGKKIPLTSEQEFNISFLFRQGCSAKSISEDLSIRYEKVCNFLKREGNTLKKGRQPNTSPKEPPHGKTLSYDLYWNLHKKKPSARG